MSPRKWTLAAIGKDTEQAHLGQLSEGEASETQLAEASPSIAVPATSAIGEWGDGIAKV